jgi:hypothetical protein
MLMALAALTLAGCATPPTATPDLDAAAKTFAVPPGKANIYLFRDEVLGGAIAMDVYLNGKLMGQTGPTTYFKFEVLPGRYSILSKAENDSSIDVQAEAGRNYFVWQEVKMGMLYARNLLQQVDEQRGRAGVAQCKLIAANP